MSNNQKMLPIGKASRYLGISRDTLRRWEKRGKLKPLRSPTDRRYYTKEQLDAVMSGTKVKNSEKTSKISEQRGSKNMGKGFQLLGFGTISFIIAALLSFLVQYFFLK